MVAEMPEMMKMEGGDISKALKNVKNLAYELYRNVRTIFVLYLGQFSLMISDQVHNPDLCYTFHFIQFESISIYICRRDA